MVGVWQREDGGKTLGPGLGGGVSAPYRLLSRLGGDRRPALLRRGVWSGGSQAGLRLGFTVAATGGEGHAPQEQRKRYIGDTLTLFSPKPRRDFSRRITDSKAFSLMAGPIGVKIRVFCPGLRVPGWAIRLVRAPLKTSDCL